MNESPTPSGMSHAFKVAVVVLVFFGIFAAGVFTGGLVMARVAGHRAERFGRERRDEEQARETRREAELRDHEQQRDQVELSLRQAIQALREQAERQPQQRMPGGPGPFGPQLMQRMFERINPTPDQRARIRPLVFQAGEQLRRLRQDTAHSTEQILAQLQDQVRGLLTPDQVSKFDVMIERWREAFRKYDLQQQLRNETQRRRERPQSWQWRDKDQGRDPGQDGPQQGPNAPPASPAPKQP